MHGKEIPEPLTVFFLVQRSEQYRFTMNGVSFLPWKGSPQNWGGNDYAPAPGTEELSLFPPRHAPVHPGVSGAKL